MKTRFVTILMLWVALPFQVGLLSAQPPLPRPDHIVIVIEENHSLAQIVDSSAAPYLNELIHQGATGK